MNMKQLTVQMREYIKNISREYLADKSEEINKFKQKVLAVHGIDYSEYVLPGKGQLKRFMELMPDIFALRSENNGTVWYCAMADKQSFNCARILGELVEKNGRFHLAKIDKELKEHGIDYRDYSGKKGLKGWIESEFGNYFKISDDGYYLMPLSVCSTTNETLQMNSLAFMSWWVNNSHILNTYTQSSNSGAEWSQIIARALCMAILGINPMFTSHQGDEQLVVFDTTAKTAAGNSVYCVLASTPSDKAAKFALEGFCCPAQEDDGLGKKIKDEFPDIVKSTSVLDVKYKDLSTIVKQLTLQRSELMPCVEALKDSIEKGCDIDTAAYELIGQYHDKWQQANELLGSLGIKDDGAPVSIFTLSDRLEFKNRKTTVLKNVIDICVTSAQGLHAYCKENMLHTTCDVIGQDIDAIASSDISSCAKIADIISYYICLWEITTQHELTDSVIEKFESVKEHFPALTERVLMHFFMGKSAEADALSNLGSLNEIADMMASLESGDSSEDTNLEFASIDIDALLDKCINLEDEYDMASVLTSVAYFPATGLEKMIVYARYDDALEMLEGDNDGFCPSKSNGEIADALRLLKSGSNGFTFYECARRLLKTIGNYNRTAEKYLIAGLVCDADRCSKALFDLYMNENNTSGYLSLWRKFGGDFSDDFTHRSYLLEVLASDGENTINQYLSNHVYILYMPNYATILADIALKYGHDELAARCTQSLEHITSMPEYNDFELSVINAHDDEIKEYLTEKQFMLTLFGYSPDEQRQLILAAQSEAADQSIEKSAAERLYDMQKNKNGTVERLVWTSLASQFSSNDALILLNILNDAKRRGECTALYECYKDKFTTMAKAREIYIINLLGTDAAKARDFIAANMMDFMTLLCYDRAGSEELFDTVKELSCHEDEHISQFFAAVARLREYLANPVLCSIITLSGELRDLVTDNEKLSELGLSQSRIESCASIFKTDSYSRGRDVRSISERLYTFVGISQDAAREFAMLALSMSLSAIALVWKIVCDYDNEDEKLSLFRSYPQLQQTHIREYCTLLLQKQLYQEFLEVANQQEISDSELTIQTIIAKCHIPEEAADVSCDNVESVEGVGACWTALMLKSLCMAGKTELAHEFLIAHFDEMLAQYTSDELMKVVSANGALNRDAIEDVQKSAIDAESEKLAVYIYENCGIGSLDEYSKALYSKLIAMYKTCDAIEQQNIIKQLKTIYSSKNSFMSEIALMEIRHLACKQDADETDINAIADQLEGVSLGKEEITELMLTLEGVEQLLNDRIYSSVVRLCSELGLEKECIAYLGKISSTLFEHPQNDIFPLLCRLYTDAICGGYFSDDWRGYAEQVCTMLLDTPCYCDAAFCMYNIQKAYGNIHASKFILSTLLDQKHSIPASMLDAIEYEAKEVLGEETAGLFDLFVEAVAECDMNEIADYCRFCGSFIKLEAAMLKEADTLTLNPDGKIYSVQNGEILLKLIYKYPDNPSYWERAVNLPFEDNTAAFVKVCYRACLMNSHNEDLWNKCITACERYGHEQLISSVLLDCAISLPSEYAMPRFRTSLAQKVNTNPLYFSRMEDKGQLTELVSVLCKRLESDSVNRANYSAIRDISAIAVATDSAAAFEIMLGTAEKYIFGEYSNLGFAIACRLILRKRFDEALAILKRLINLGAIKYHALISKLSQMDAGELANWGAEEINRQLVKMILPDGNYPDIMQINEFALSCTNSGKAEEGARLLCELIDNIPTDYGCHMALFMVCKQIPHRIDYLHHALCGLIRNEPAGNSKTYYSRTRKDYAILLANINAVIIAKHETESVSRLDGYDFRKSAREYYCEYENEDVDIQALGEIEDAQTNIQNALMNQQAIGFDIMCSVVTSWVTGNWTDVVIRCWRENIDIGNFIEYYSDINNGFARSVLRAVYSLGSSERDSFMSYLEQNCAQSEKSHLDRAVHLYNCDFYSQLPPDVLEGNILDFPFEEYSLFNLTFNSTVRQFISKAPSMVYPCAMIVSTLAFFGNSMIEFWQTAMTAFENSNDVVANGLFAALHHMWKKYKISHKQESDTRKSPEKYEALYRVTGVFSGNEQVIAKVSGPDFHSWSCINMVMGLLYTKRANEVNRLKMSFADNNKKIVDVILTGINPSKTDDEKINAIKSLYDDVSRALICFILKLYDKNTKKPAFVKEATTIQLLNDIYYEVAEKYPSEFARSPRRFLWIETAKIHENAYSQINEDAEFEEYDIVEPSEVTESANEYTLSFVANLMPEDGEAADIAQLWLEHENMTDNYSAKLDITARIYSQALASGAEAVELTDYAMRYGVDYYRYCMSQKDYDAANSAIKEMATVYDSSTDAAGHRLFKDIVCNTALHELLHRGYTDIHSMTKDYAKHKTAFIRMRNMLPASSMQKELDDVNAIYTSLETLVKCFGELSSSHTSGIKNALINAKKQLGEMKQAGWVNVKLAVLNMIQDEINRVDQRPILSFEVLSTKANKSYGSIYGQIRNMGKTTAENIVIQLDCETGYAGDSYELPMLENGDTAAFEIDYSAPDDADALTYSIVASYSSNNEKYNDICSAKLTIHKEPCPDFSTGLYLTDRPIMDFTIASDGSVVSDNFFGRNEEKQKIRSVFAGGSFINYKNVIVNGIRRAGKTSILNYLLKYAEANCSDAVTCMVTCEGISTDSPIQYVLIDAVIKHLRLLAGENADAQQWDSFTEKWKLAEGCADRNADDLQYFYRELKQLNGGKGLVLVIDEIDILFEYVEKNQGLDSTLFPALRTLLCNMYCQEAVHLVICGSNKLIRYMDGGTLNQLFQQFGDNIIEVGRLLTNDMNEMLTKPYELNYPHVQFTKEALGWIWKYTSGLVWYAKLLSNCALNRAKSKGRCVVYPSDVADGLFDVIGNDNFFKSLITSCRPNELKILDAMQSHTSKAGEYISLGKLMQILSGEFSQKDIETIIGTLERMNLVTRNLYDRYSYRFAVELYWHYFRVYPSNYERVPDISSVFKKCKATFENQEYENY